MADLTLTNTITNGSALDADEVQTSFDEVVADINANCVRTDGSNTMTAALTLVGSDPSSANHAVRKSYLDGAYVCAQGASNQTWAADTYQTVKFATEVRDSHSAYNASTGEFTVPKTGIYLVTFTISKDQEADYIIRSRIVADSVNYLGPSFTPSGLNGLNEDAIIVHALAVYATASSIIKPQCSVSSAGAGTYALGETLTIAWLHGLGS